MGVVHRDDGAESGFSVMPKNHVFMAVVVRRGKNCHGVLQNWVACRLRTMSFDFAPRHLSFNEYRLFVLCSKHADGFGKPSRDKDECLHCVVVILFQQ